MSEVFIDPRDGQTYKTVKIGNQIWLAENLKYKSPVKKFNNWTIEEKDFYYPPNGENKNIKQYGCLYTWENALKACPKGWQMPSKKEFWGLLSYVKKHRKSANNFLALIAKSTAWSNYKDQGGDDFTFGALPAGCCYCGGDYDFLGHDAFFWSATEDDSDNACSLILVGDDAYVNLNIKAYAFSVRCIKD